MARRVRTVVIPVGGWGTRFLPATKTTPKEMLPIVDKPLIQYAIEEAAASGIERFVLVTAHGKHTIEDHFDQLPELNQFLERRGRHDLLADLEGCVMEAGRVCYVRQPEPLGLGHAIACARFVVEEPFAVMLPDDLILSQRPVLKQMLEAYDQSGGTGQWMAVMPVSPDAAHRYGIVDPNAAMPPHANPCILNVRGVVEKPLPGTAPSDWAIIGRYILQPEIFDVLSHQKSGQGNEIQLTDAIETMMDHTPGFGYIFEGERFDCGNKLEFVSAVIAQALRHPGLGPSLRAKIPDLLKS